MLMALKAEHCIFCPLSSVCVCLFVSASRIQSGGVGHLCVVPPYGRHSGRTEGNGAGEEEHAEGLDRCEKSSLSLCRFAVAAADALMKAVFFALKRFFRFFPLVTSPCLLPLWAQSLRYLSERN